MIQNRNIKQNIYFSIFSPFCHIHSHILVIYLIFLRMCLQCRKYTVRVCPNFCLVVCCDIQCINLIFLLSHLLLIYGIKLAVAVASSSAWNPGRPSIHSSVCPDDGRWMRLCIPQGHVCVLRTQGGGGGGKKKVCELSFTWTLMPRGHEPCEGGGGGVEQEVGGIYDLSKRHTVGRPAVSLFPVLQNATLLFRPSRLRHSQCVSHLQFHGILVHCC